jgi:uncharacterized membrane protein YdjX (TVP38/TMEM64 family)
MFSGNKKKLIINILLVLVTLFASAGLSILILSAFNVVSFENGIVFNPHLFESFKNSWYGWIIFILFQALLTILLCIVPGVSMAFIILCSTIYTEPWQAFLISFLSVIISSLIMYLLGRFGGYKLCVKLLGKEDCDKSLDLLETKSTIFFPLMMLFPVFPDDALVMIAGTIKMKLKWFIPSIILGRGIGIATIVFGFSLIPFDSFTTLYDWIVFITVCVVWIFVIFHFANKLNKKIESKNKNN